MKCGRTWKHFDSNKPDSKSKHYHQHRPRGQPYYVHHHRNRNKSEMDRSSCSSVMSTNRNRYGRRASSMISIGSCGRCCPERCTRPLCKTWKRLRAILKNMVKHNYFQQAIFLAILLNTFSMGIEYHNQPQSLSHAVEISNIIFTIIFCIEMVLKLLAQGFYEYIRSGFNVFDGCIVILSLLELLEEHGSGLSVLRTFRLLRILKLVRFMPALRRQLVIMLRTIDNVAVFFALLLLFIFIFSILGMNLFGCKFCDRNPIDQTLQCDRKNFDSLLWALVTVFQY
ncbi:hypothetical protein BLA29_004100 [Euroglyphus maynei]|uniref:Ion transport domain-containing protein n=1 Tax=Euroglyphus maynei TaxID=6958 RepID=A0A1Y3BVE5_EURMA|nr:hypothetical protein BLA29_004100 [Euroglyphus maynei]